MSPELLKELIDYLADFEAETGPARDLGPFAAWLSRRTEQEAVVQPREIAIPLDAQIMEALGTLTVHARHYAKTILQDTPLVSFHDYFFLSILCRKGDLRKTELIEEGMLEQPSGAEIIRRLLRHDLIEDFPDLEDGRARRVRPTEAGRQMVARLSPEMMHGSRIVAGKLNAQEKLQLASLLRQLVHFHQPIWEQDRGRPLEEITKKYLAE